MAHSAHARYARVPVRSWACSQRSRSSLRYLTLRPDLEVTGASPLGTPGREGRWVNVEDLGGLDCRLELLLVCSHG